MMSVRGMLRAQTGLKAGLPRVQTFYRNHSHNSTSEPVNELLDLNNESNFASGFKIFPSMADVKIDDLLGSDNFSSEKYHVARSSKGNLPVYTDFKNGIEYTEVRKIKGNSVRLRDDLAAMLSQVDKKHFKVVPQSNKIVIKGPYSSQVKKILSGVF